MVLRSRLPATLLLALGALPACLQLNEHALPISGADAGPDAGDAAVAPAPDANRDLPPAPADAGDTAAPVPPDATATECTPRELGCTPDDKAIRTCSADGHWMVTTTCPAQTACSAGVCLCPGSCAEEPLLQTQTSGIVEDLVGGGTQLYLAVNGPQASIRRFDVLTRKEAAPVKTGGGEPTFFSLDSDAMGNLLWCSDVRSTHTGQLVYGTQQLETGACTHLRRHGNQVYFLGDLLYRKTLDAAAKRETVTTTPMTTFEIGGEFLYFIAMQKMGSTETALLERLPLGDPTKVETLLRADNVFTAVMPDASHVYLVADGQILRVPLTGAAAPETFWQDTPDAWALAQTDTHVYWSTTTASGSEACSEAQVLRRAKAGGPVTVLSRTPGLCGGQLVRIGDALYTVVWAPLGTAPAKILRIRL
jgi:hypothetical protein